MLNLLIPIAVGLLLVSAKKGKAAPATSEVGALLPPASPYAFSWWVQKPGIGFVFSGWQGPTTLTWQAMNTRMARLTPEKQFARVLRWSGSAWETPV